MLARGLVVRSGGLLARWRSFAADLGGLVGGWSAAVLQHSTRRRAPASHVLASLIALAGRAAGKVPATAASALRAQTFAGFCRFQAAAELTAVVSWERIADVLEAHERAAPLAPVARRIAADEQHHKAVLGIFLDAFDDDDQLREGFDEERLREALGTIDGRFVARGTSPADESLGRGGTVFVREAEAARRASPEALRKLLREVLVDTGLLGQLFASGPKARVAVKTTFMMSYDRRDPSPHVDPTLAEELARLLREHGATDVAFIEAPNHYDRFFGRRRVAEVAKYLDLESDLYRIVDASDEQEEHTFARGFGQDSICRTWRDADLRIAFGKMRTHPSWLVHLTLNGLVP